MPCHFPKGHIQTQAMRSTTAQTHSRLDSRLQALVPLDNHWNFANNCIVVTLWMMWNPHHSHACACKLKIHVSPLSNQKAQILANYTNFAGHFPIWTTENGTLKIYSKLCKICSICPLSLQIMQNSPNLHQFPKVLCTHEQNCQN